MNERQYQILTLVVGLAIVGLLGTQVVGLASSEATQDYVDDSAEWCGDRGGELVNVHAVVHGGLHCDLPNGTSVHMSEVVGNGA